MQRLIAFAFGAFVLSHGFDSLLRWGLELLHLGPLIYARDGIAAVAVLAGVLDLVARDRHAMVVFGAVMGLVGAAAVGFAADLPIAQIAFGIKVWLPMLLGMVVVTSGAVHVLDRRRAWLGVWCVLLVGIFTNLFVTYPWTGMVMQVGDTAVMANREWSTGGFARVSGFSRTSFDAAICIILLGFYLVITGPRLAARASIWLLTGAAVVLTTTKATIGVFIVATPMLPLIMATPRPHASRFARKIVPCATLGAVAVVGLAAPVITSQIDLPLLETGTLEHLMFASLIDRAWSTWPTAWSLLDSWQIVLGRGVGGIGAAQSYFELARSSPADNLFVYLYVTAGLPAAALYCYVAGLCWKLDLASTASRLCYCVLLFLFVDGLTTNVIECAPALAVIGAACVAALHESRHAQAVHGVTRDAVWSQRRRGPPAAVRSDMV